MALERTSSLADGAVRSGFITNPTVTMAITAGGEAAVVVVVPPGVTAVDRETPKRTLRILRKTPRIRKTLRALRIRQDTQAKETTATTTIAKAPLGDLGPAATGVAVAEAAVLGVVITIAEVNLPSTCPP